MNGHVGDDAELYALGMLDPTRRLQIDAHAASCGDCLSALGEAEETAAALATMLPRVAPPAALAGRLRAATNLANPAVVPISRRAPHRRRGWLAGLAVAAALLLAIGTSWYQNGVLQGKLAANDVAVAMLVHSHFSHVPMTTTPAGGALAAKAIYARDGSWLYVVVDGASGDLEISATIDGKPWSGGRAIVNGTTASLFVRPPGRPQSVELTRDGTPVASAKLIY